MLHKEVRAFRAKAKKEIGKTSDDVVKLYKGIIKSWLLEIMRVPITNVINDPSLKLDCTNSNLVLKSIKKRRFLKILVRV